MFSIQALLFLITYLKRVRVVVWEVSRWSLAGLSTIENISVILKLVECCSKMVSQLVVLSSEPLQLSTIVSLPSDTVSNLTR